MLKNKKSGMEKGFSWRFYGKVEGGADVDGDCTWYPCYSNNFKVIILKFTTDRSCTSAQIEESFHFPVNLESVRKVVTET